MGRGILHLLAVTNVALLLSGCFAAKDLTASADLRPPAPVGAKSAAKPADPESTGSIPVPHAVAEPLPDGQPDDIALGKKAYHANDFELSEQYFRRAVERSPKSAEAWLGLAASYDCLRRFDKADRAYEQVIALSGVTAEILNNQGYSYILRGDYKNAREKLTAAKRLDPGNKYVLSNLQLLVEGPSRGKRLE